MHTSVLCRAGLVVILIFLGGLIQVASAQQIIYEDSFENGVIDTQYWTSRPSLAGASGGIVEVRNTGARTGTFSVYMGRSSDGALTTNALDLNLDLSGQTEVELRFWIKDFFNEETDQDGLYFSDNGGTSFEQVTPFVMENEPDNVYMNPPPIDVDALAAANGLSLTSTFVIRFQQVGDADFGTGGDEDGFIIDDVSVTAPVIEFAKLPFTDGFENGSFGPMWRESNASDPATGQPTALAVAPSRLSGRVDVEGANARTGTFAALMGRNTDGALTTNALDLLLDLSGETEVELRFWMKDFLNEETDQDGLYFSDDGGASFVQVFPMILENEPDNVYMNPPPIDVDELAAANGLSLTSTFVVRFQQVGDADFGTSGDEDGIFIDDVSVTSPEIEYVSSFPFSDSFEEGVFGPMWHEANASDPAVGQPTALSLAPARLSGRVDVEASNARTGTFSVFVGRNTDGALTTNALDLLLDLSGQTDVELRFWMKDFLNEETEQDGLYFSDDGGASFVHVFPFVLENEPDNVYMNPPPIDVDALADANGLSLSSTFVIRFQQVGDADFGTSGDEDGFMIDDVSVIVPEISYAALRDPVDGGRFAFSEGFEEGVLGSMWQETNPSDPAVGEPTALPLAPSRLSGRVAVEASNQHAGTFAVLMGRNTDGQLTTNALDFRVNLEGQSEVELRFWMKDFFNEESEQDGLYFSDNGGASFKQVVMFETSTQPDNSYFETVVDVDALASANGLSLTSTFVIRFQQVGDADFGTSGDEDGMFFDDILISGDVITVIVANENEEIPEVFSLGTNYPNPFNPSTTIPFSLDRPAEVRLSVYDLLGREVAVLIKGQRPAGEQAVLFDARNLPSGVYLYRLNTGSRVEVKQMTLMK